MADKSTIKQIAEQKLKAFSIGAMGKRPLSKREQEELRKREEDKAAAHAFEEFMETFTEAPASKASKVWVKAGTYDAGKRQEDTKDKGKLYKPQSRLMELADKLSTSEKAAEYARLMGDKKPDKPSKKKAGDKKKSNLELFKDELKMIQEEREERHKYKGAMKAAELSSTDSNSTHDIPSLMSTSLLGQRPVILPEDTQVGSYDCGDPNTTNIYLGNLNPKITQQHLMELFGKYGPLASIKIMWPRTDEEKARGKNCGFVAFMNRKDGERAMKNLNGKEVMQYEMKLGWGKAVPIPHHPIYIPPLFVELTMPPPPSGLPFNSQPLRKDKHKVQKMLRGSEQLPKEELDRVLVNATVKVVIPTDRPLLMLINRTIEFVIREGPMFEAMIMNKEIQNPMYRFLFENQSPAHIYYRWKLYSLLQGDTQTKWNINEFRMFKGGSIWRPPPMNQYTQGMPEDLIEDHDEFEPRKGTLSNTQRDRLEDLLRNIGPERIRVAETMVFCIEHAEAAEEICDCISESLSLSNTPIHKKIARLYLISDILHNCGVKITNASNFRRCLESRLMGIFADVHAAYMNLESRMKAEGFKTRVMTIFRAWEDWAVYPRDFLIRLQNTFLGLALSATIEEEVIKPNGDEMIVNAYLDLDGAPLDDIQDDDDLDGLPLDGAALLKSASKSFHSEDIDGIPMDDLDGKPLDGNALNNYKKSAAGFVPSKWETVDPDQIEAQAMTTSKWDMLEPPHQDELSKVSRDDSDEMDSQEDETLAESRVMNEERRAMLREIEVKVMQYQDELECGTRKSKSGWTVAQQVEHFRRKLTKRAEKGRLYEEKETEREMEILERSEKRRRHSPSHSSSRKSSKRSRSDSSSPQASNRSRRSRSRSDSPIKKSSRRSRSPYMKKSRGISPSSPLRLSPPYSSKKSRLSSPKSSSLRNTSPYLSHRSSSPSSRGKRRDSLSPVRKHHDYSPLSSSRKHSPSRSKHSSSKHRTSIESPTRKKHKYKY